MSDVWEVVERRELLDGSPWFKVYTETVRLEDEKTLIPDFYRIEIPAYTIIFPVSFNRQVVLIEQYKHGIGRRIFELPAGYIEPGESPLLSAQRELLEETGLEASEWRSLGVFTVDGN